MAVTASQITLRRRLCGRSCSPRWISPGVSAWRSIARSMRSPTVAPGMSVTAAVSQSPMMRPKWAGGRRLGRGGLVTSPLPTALAERIESLDALDAPAQQVGKTVRSAIPDGPVKDGLSGTWLGHALHPLLTDL